MLLMIECSTGLYVGECTQGPQDIGQIKRAFQLTNAVRFQFSYFPIMVQQESLGGNRVVPQIIENRQDHWQPIELLIVTESYAWGWLQDSDKLAILYENAKQLRQQQTDQAQAVILPEIKSQTVTDHIRERARKLQK